MLSQFGTILASISLWVRVYCSPVHSLPHEGVFHIPLSSQCLTPSPAPFSYSIIYDLYYEVRT